MGDEAKKNTTTQVPPKQQPHEIILQNAYLKRIDLHCSISLGRVFYNIRLEQLLKRAGSCYKWTA